MKVSSELEICNLALLTIGQHTIASLDKNALDEEETLQAETCRYFYDQARMSLLSRYNWTFAIRRLCFNDKEEEEINDDTDRKVCGYKYACRVNSDFLKLVFVKDILNNDLIPITGMKPPYIFENNVIFADVHPLIIGYVADVESIPAFSSLFIDCLILELAIRLSKIFNDSTTFRQELQMSLENKINEAKRLDCQQIIMDSIQSYPLLRSYYGAI